MWYIIVPASLVALIGLILCVPVDSTFRVDVYGKPKFSVRIEWLFGLVGREITDHEKKGKGKREEAQRGPRLKGKAHNVRMGMDILRTRGFPGHVQGLIKDLIHRIEIRNLSMDFRIGLGDPADTGLLFAVINPTLLFLRPSSASINLQPAFENDFLIEGYSYGRVRLCPIHFVLPSLRFIFSLTTARVVIKMVRAKWKRKK
ncbi:MAG: DUF2953 domain-containing protein [Chloroflexota bacterium]